MTVGTGASEVKARFGTREWIALMISLAMLTITAGTVIYAAGRQEQRLRELERRTAKQEDRSEKQDEIHIRTLQITAAISERLARMEGRP